MCNVLYLLLFFKANRKSLGLLHFFTSLHNC